MSTGRSTPERTRVAFDRVLHALRGMEPLTLRALRPGVAPERWPLLHERIGTSFPEEARPVWEFHDGEDEERSINFLAGWRLLAVYEMEKKWALLGDVSAEHLPIAPSAGAPFRSDMWDPGWIPLAEDGGGGTVVLDTNPSERGRVGQVLQHHVAEIDAGLWEAEVGGARNRASLVRRDAEPPW